MEKTSIIENYATGKALQIMASTGDKIIHGKNQGLGEETAQLGGHVNDDTIQQFLRSMGGIFGPTTGLDSSSLGRETTVIPLGSTVEKTSSSFKGKGIKLASNPSSGTQTMLSKPSEEESRK
jgi:hypothetical protein